VFLYGAALFFDEIPMTSPTAFLVDLLRAHADDQHNQRAYTFLMDGETTASHLTYGELDRQARAIGAMLQQTQALGDRALLLYPPGLEYIAAFFGCLYAGVVAVPAYPPNPARLARTLPRLHAIIADARPAVVLTTEALLPLAGMLAGADGAGMRWLATDALTGDHAEGWRPPALDGATLALLQYTSGSTAAPKGVMLSHANLLHNSALIQRCFGHSSESRGVIWLPPYHDMGLIGGIIQPLYASFPVVLMSPLAFLERPLRWLQAITRYQATTSGGPNFAYDLCVRKTTPEQRATLDLASWRVAFNGAEPIRAATLERFTAAFAPAGFRRAAFVPCYGLAEATLIVSGGPANAGPAIHSFDAAALGRNQAIAAAGAGSALVGCGEPLPGQKVLIAQPETQIRCASGEVGEIWLAGPSVAQGYWGQPTETAQAFQARVADAHDGPFLRTGDLGFVKDGELFITGRLKDVIIIRGRNYYPQDIELTVERSHAALRPGCCAAFTVEHSGADRLDDRLVVVQEVERNYQAAELGAMIAAIRQAVSEQHELQVHTVVLLGAGSIPKTSSGKIQRHACRAAFLAGDLAAVGQSALDDGAEAQLSDTLPEPLRAASRSFADRRMGGELGRDRTLVVAYLRQIVAEVLNVALSRVDPELPISAFGLDSLMAVELQNRVEHDLGAVVPMVRFLEGTSVAALATLVLEQLAAQTTQAALLQPIPRDGPLPLSFAQERIWLLDQLAPGDATFIPVAVRLTGRLDVTALEQSINAIIERHEILRTTFMAIDGRPVQLRAPARHLAIAVLQLAGLAAAEREAMVLRLAAEEVQRPFDLARGPLLRATLLRLGPAEYVLLLTMHHIVSDGWSLGVFMRELATIYAAVTSGQPSPLPDLPIQYADYAIWQRAWLDERREQQLAYWRARLSGELPALELPTDRLRPAVQTFRGARHVLVLTPALSAALHELSQRESATLFMTLLAGFLAILARYTGQPDIIVGTPITGRTHAKITGLIGFFVNTLVLRTDLSGDPSFRALLGRVREVCLGAYDHQDLPFDHLLKELQPERDLSRTPLFQVFFNLLSFPDSRIELPGLLIESLIPPEVGAKYDVTLYAEEQPDGIRLELVYNADLFTAARMAELLRQLQYLLEQASVCPEQPYTQYSLITPQARAALPDPHAPLELRWDGAVQARFAVQARRLPDQPALADPYGHWSYAELDARSNQLAHYLIAQGIGPQEIVAIYAHRSAALVWAVLGVLKAGAAFIILDPAYPPARLIDRMRLARPRGWLQLEMAGAPTDELAEFLATLSLCCQLTLPRRPADAAGPLAKHAITATTITVAPDDLAYVAFTSGSTGRPKGIIGTHRPLAHFLHWYARAFELSAADQFCMLSGLAHDPLLRDIFAPLWLGATLHIPDPDAIGSARLLTWMQRVSVAHLTPAMGRLLLDSAPANPNAGAPLLPGLRYALLSGDVLTRRDIARFRMIAPSVTCVNVYGATESPQVAVYYVVPADDAADGLKEGLPVGRGIADVQLLVLNSAEQVAGVSELGELYIRTPYLAQGYLGNEVLTRARFLPSPFASGGDRQTPQSAICNLQSAMNDRLYRTGDLGRYLPDGNVEFCGRVDQQVKIRGFRVELEEIEGVLGEHPAVLEAAVSTWDDQASTSEYADKRLVAYVVPTNNERRTTNGEERDPSFVLRPSSVVSELRAYLKRELPDFMVPSAFVLLDALPLTPNNKLDRRALPSPDLSEHAPHDGFVAARTPAEQALARIWAEVLRLNQVGVHDNFFALGGHSLLATQLIARIRDAFQLDLPLRSLFESPTVAELALAIARRSGEPAGAAEPDLVLPRCVPDPAHWHEPFPLTDIQQAYWVGRRGAFELGNVATHSYLEIATVGLDLERFTRAWRRLIEQHGMLRAIVLPDGRQQILERVPPYQVVLLDLRALSPVLADAQLAAVRQRMSHQVLPSERWPLFEIRATRLDDQRTRLHISTDALISDAWSRQILAREFVRLYADPATTLAALELSFRDYVLAEVALRDTELYRRALVYWRDRLATLPPAPELPLAQNVTELEHPRFVRRSASLPAETWQQLRCHATATGLTPSGVLLAAFAEVLAVWSKHPRFTINLTLFNRLPLHPQVPEIMGDFTSPTLLAVNSRAAATFAEQARRIQEQLWVDLDQRYVSGVQVLRDLARMHGGGRRPTMPVVFTSTLMQGGTNDGVFALNQLGEIVYSISQTPQVWLDHQVYEHAGTLVFNWDSVDELFPAGLISDMFAAYCGLLQRLSDDAASWHAPIRLLPTAQLDQQAAINATAAPLPSALLHTLFADQLAQRPDQVAVVAPGRTLTYAQLGRRAAQLGRRLRTLGARPNMLVAVVMEKGWEQVVAVLGVLQAGAAYLPIDAGAPPERLRYMLEHAAVTLALTQPWLDARLRWPEGIQRLCIAGDDTPDRDERPLEPLQSPLDLAYVIYTSGSTGLPKGVMIDHRAAVNTILDLNQRHAIGPADRVLALSALSFDLSVYDIFGMLAAGGAIILPEAAAARDPSRWTHLLEQHGVTLWNSVPALLEMLVEYLAGRPTLPALALRLAWLSGDWIPLGLPDQLRALAPGVELIGMGGATEAAIWSIRYPIGAVDPAWKSIPYGKPMLNQSFYVLDERLDPRPTWVPGQLYIGGVGLAQGYLGRPDLTAERFVPNPLARPEDERRMTNDEADAPSFVRGPSSCVRLYKTGDLGRYLPDGTIEFLGREDFQVKIQGYRIELGEIEAALVQHPLVRTAVVAALGEPRGSRQLVAYVVPTTDDRRSTNGARPVRSVGGDLRDPRVRLQYKLRQPGQRPNQQQPTVQLPERDRDEAALAADYLRRRSYRSFCQAPILLDQLSALLSCLRPASFPGAPFPKYRYGSAGSLYPVQTYLYVKPDRVTGLAGGIYYYEPKAHQLVRVAGAQIDRSVYTPANRALFNDAAFALFLVGQISAITPLYGEHSQRFAMIEAGAMTQLLEQSAPEQLLGLCQIGNLDFERIRELLALDEQQLLLHSLLGGAIAPDQPQLAGFLQAAGAYAAMLELMREQPGDDLLEDTEPRRQEDQATGRSGDKEKLHVQGSGVREQRSGDLDHSSSFVLRPSSLIPELRDFLRERLPEYMVPTAFVLLDALPLSANGKVDRAGLPRPDAPTAQDAAFVAPQTGIEQGIAAIIREVLQVEKVGVNDNFFDLGGNSLHLVQSHGRIQAALACDIPLVEMFNNPTISALAGYLNRRQAAAPPPEDQDDQLQASKDRLGKLRKRSAR
jgi:amino acid adenylation domain-containing protein